MKIFVNIMGFLWAITGLILTFSPENEIQGWIMFGFGITWIAMEKDK